MCYFPPRPATVRTITFIERADDDTFESTAFGLQFLIEQRAIGILATTLFAKSSLPSHTSLSRKTPLDRVGNVSTIYLVI